LSFKIPRHPLNFFAGASRCGLCSQLRKHCSTCHSVFPCMLNLVPPPPSVYVSLWLSLPLSIYVCLCLSLSCSCLHSISFARLLAFSPARWLARSQAPPPAPSFCVHPEATPVRQVSVRCARGLVGRVQGGGMGARTEHAHT
jgi:hypothetical protein